MRRYLYAYNPAAKPPLPLAVRMVLRQAESPLTFEEVVARVRAFGIMSYDINDAVYVILKRMAGGSELVRTKQ